MPKQAQIEPRWLVSLLNQWARHDLRSNTGGLGYASGSSWMRGLKSSPASSIDPTGFAARDFRDIDAAMVWLCEAYKPTWAAVNMYYKPWVIEAFKDEGYPFGAGNKTYYNRLHDGHARLAMRLNEMKAERLKLMEKEGLREILLKIA